MDVATNKGAKEMKTTPSVDGIPMKEESAVELSKFERFFFGYCVGLLDGARDGITKDQYVEYLKLREYYTEPTVMHSVEDTQAKATFNTRVIEQAITSAIEEERERCAEIARTWSVYRWVKIEQIKGEKTISGKENYERLAKAIEEG